MKAIGNEIIGQVFGRLTVLAFAGHHRNGRRIVLCKCECGTEKTYDLGAVRHGNSTSCGCYKKPMVTDADVTGLVFGRLTVLKRIGTSEYGAVVVQCRCTCGNLTKNRMIELRAGVVASCGCLRAELICTRGVTHGYTKGGKHTKEYRAWSALKNRCNSPNGRQYKDYGGRGITVCERWEKFENFLEDMGKSPPFTSIERIDNNKGYSKDNCKWATGLEQVANRRCTVWVELNGIRKPVFRWAAEFGISGHTAWSRLKRGWPPERLFTPPRKFKNANSNSVGSV